MRANSARPFIIPHVLVVLTAGLLMQAWAAASANDSFEDGADTLFMGHSFFVPVAKSFDSLAKSEGYSRHTNQLVFAGGPKGTPSALWDDAQKKSRIEDILATGNIDLLGMTAIGNRGDGGLQDYRQWIDLALGYNPNTVFFIGYSWIPGGTKMNAAQFDQKIEETGNDAYAVVEELRQLYPSTTIHFINYGKVASIMRTMFDAGELDDVTKLSAFEGKRGRNVSESGRRSIIGRMRNRRQGADTGSTDQPVPEANRTAIKGALFADGNIGHAGPMMTEMCARIWLHYLYGADTDAISSGNWNAADVKEITSGAIEFNRRYIPN